MVRTKTDRSTARSRAPLVAWADRDGLAPWRWPPPALRAGGWAVAGTASEHPPWSQVMMAGPDLDVPLGASASAAAPGRRTAASPTARMSLEFMVVAS